MKINKEEIEKTVMHVIADRLDVDIKKIRNDTLLLNELGMDSFGAVELTFELKDRFGIEIPQEQFSKIKKVKDIVKYISTHLNEK